jgi:hypothetical protein
MRNPKTVCREHGLYSFQAMRGAEAMMRAISEDVLHILLTTDVRPIHERVAEYFNLNKL